MSISRIEINAYLDGEISPVESDRIKQTIAEDERLSAELGRLDSVHRLLRDDRERMSREEILETQTAILSRLQHSVRGLRVRRSWWESDVRLPLPVAAAATVAFLLMTTMFVVQSARPARPDAGTIVGEGAVNLQVNVDDTDALLSWLNQQEAVNNVTIRLPEQAEFYLRSAPVLMRRDESGGGFLPVPPMHTSDEEDSWEIVPLEEGER